MGVTAFTTKLRTHFLDQLRDEDIPKHLDPNDKDAVHAWFKEAFGYWFLEHRDDLLGGKWAGRGWAESVLEVTDSGKLTEAFRVKPEHAQKIDAWLQDEID